MKLATWNVNSIGARLPRVLEFLELHVPDVLCMQETKCGAEAFPHQAFGELGYTAVESGSGRWCGVAIAVRQGLEAVDVVRELPGNPLPDEARWIEATVDGLRVVSVYVVNGRALEDPMYEAKLAFLDAMAARVRELEQQPLLLAGDFNIAPADIDVYDPEAFIGATHVSAPERDRLGAILDAGLVDAFRHVEPALVQHTWWDYRQGHFHRGLGLRIDLALVSRGLASGLRSVGMIRDFRKGAKPSDHAPLLLELDLASTSTP